RLALRGVAGLTDVVVVRHRRISPVCSVMAGLVPAIHVFAEIGSQKTWMPGTIGLCWGRRSRTRVPGMTVEKSNLTATVSDV
ncbi:MAG: hypothetical protein WA820_07605, partial [Bradyrhizobium sp.]